MFLWHGEGKAYVPVLQAIRDLKADEQVTYDYSNTTADKPRIRYHCGEDNCKGYI